MMCEECSGEFIPKFYGQQTCVKCYYELNPDKDYVKHNKERLAGALGVNRIGSNRFGSIYNDYGLIDQSKGVSDDELVFDKLNETATPDVHQKGFEPEVKRNVRHWNQSNPQWNGQSPLQKGDRMPDGAIFIGKGEIPTTRNFK
jgi:hypothetical protein